MYTDYQSETYFLTDLNLSPNGLNSERQCTVPLYQTADVRMDVREEGRPSLGHVQQPGFNTQAKGDKP
jgi:hypothetical protein